MSGNDQSRKREKTRNISPGRSRVRLRTVLGTGAAAALAAGLVAADGGLFRVAAVKSASHAASPKHVAVQGAPQRSGPGLPVFWGEWGANPAHDSVFTVPDPGVKAFATHIDHSAIADQPSVEGDVLYTATDGGHVAAVNRLTGKVLWKTTLQNQVMTTPVLVGSYAIVGIGNKLFTTPAPKGYSRLRGTGYSGIAALNIQTGQVQWEVRTAGEIMPTLAYWDGNVYAASGGGHLWAVQAATGIVEWKTRLSGFDSMSSPAIYNGTLYVDSGGEVWAVDLTNHQVVWHTKMPTVSGLSDVSPAADANYVYVDAVTKLVPHGKTGVATEAMFALDRKTGKIVWQTTEGTGTVVLDQMQTGVPVLEGSDLYVGSPVTDDVYAFNPTTGKMLWKTATTGQVRGAPALVGQDLVALDSKGYAVALNPSTGAVIASHRLVPGKALDPGNMYPMGFGPASPTVVDNVVYATTMGGQVDAFPLHDLVTGQWAGTPWNAGH